MADKLAPNILDQVRDQLVSAADDIANETERYAKGMRPYNSREVTPEQEDAIFDNMAQLYYPEQLTNEQAMQRYLEEVGSEEFVNLYKRVYAYRQKQAPQMPASDGGMPSVGG